jgi:hypothetical protein
MKKILLLACMMQALTGFTKDSIILNSGRELKVIIVDIKTNLLSYKKNKRSEVQILNAKDVAFIRIDERNILIRNLIQEEMKNQSPVDETKMLEGKLDATNFHQRGFGNFCLGFLLGPFGVVGTAIGRPRNPDYVMTPNKDNLSNPDYLKGYKRRARGKNVTNALGGWAAVIMLSIVLNN